MPHDNGHFDVDQDVLSSGTKHSQSNVLQLGPRKRPYVANNVDPLVHHGCHFSCVIHAFCNVQALLTNAILLMSEVEERGLETLTQDERKEYSAFQELLKIVPKLEDHLMSSSEEDVMTIAELVMVLGPDDMKSMKAAVIDWITPKGQTLSPHIPRNVKMGWGFHHECTGALLCPAGYEWEDIEIRAKLHSSQLQVAGDQWPLFLYAGYSYDVEDPWNSLLRSTLLVYKHIFTSPSSACSVLTSAQVFSCTDLVTDSEQFYNSIMELLKDPDEIDEVELLMGWWNQYFPLYTENKCLPSKNSALARICQKQAKRKASATITENE
ncbi:hypothetical protein EDC04DRAFT_2867958 [Pisolithus marmoratus]|nr:hypothetical protein EDC04DRAFT_2867958 [Pisolithus marmoratus]